MKTSSFLPFPPHSSTPRCILCDAMELSAGTCLPTAFHSLHTHDENDASLLSACLNEAKSTSKHDLLYGILLGQVTTLALIILIVRLLFFRGAKEAQLHNKHTPYSLSSNSKSFLSSISPSILFSNDHLAASNPLGLANSLSIFDADVFSKLDYSLKDHPIETCDWLNVLVAQMMSRYRNDPRLLKKLVSAFDEALNGDSRPSYLGPINITKFSLGTKYPVIQGALFKLFQNKPRLELSFEYKDEITVGIQTQLLINWPKPCIAGLPISLTLSLVSFTGKLVVDFIHQGFGEESCITISFLDDAYIDFDIKSLIGHHTKIKDAEKVGRMIVNKLRQVFSEECIYPNVKTVRLPRYKESTSEETTLIPTEPKKCSADINEKEQFFRNMPQLNESVLTKRTTSSTQST